VSRTVDLVITGAGDAALAAAADALQRGRRVLVVLRTGDPLVERGVRRRLRTANADESRVTVMTNAEVVCVDGVDSVEAVVIRYGRTGRLCAVNANAFLSCDGSMTSFGSNTPDRMGRSHDLTPATGG
jgi:thioredoxin reductase